MKTQNNFITKTYLNTSSVYTKHKRTMFTLRKIFTKGPKLSSLFNQKASFSTQNPSNNFQESQFDLALAMTKYFQTIFSPTSAEVLSKLTNVKNELVMYKMIAYAKSVPNPFLAKKFFQITFKKESLIFPKNTIVETVKMLSTSSSLKTVHLENPQEKSSTSGVYEVYTGELFTTQSSNVHVITYKSENPNHVNHEIQKKSLSMTGQKNCDIEVTFKTKLGHSFNSLFDILIGRNKHYKGNLIQTNINNPVSINEHLDEILKDFADITANIRFLPKDQKIFNNIIQQIGSIKQNNAFTPQNKTLLIQEQLVELIPIIRRYNSKYNPHFLVFFEERNIENEKITGIAERIQRIFPKSLNSHSSNEMFEEVFKKTIPIFIQHYHVDWKMLSPGDREYCLGLIQKFTPELYLEIMTKT